MASFRYPARVAGLRALLREAELPAVIVTHLENVRYLSGFSGSSALAILTADRALFLTDGRYTIQSAAEVPGFERIILPQGTSLAEAAGAQVRDLQVEAIAFEEAHLSVKAWGQLRDAMPEGVELVGRSDLVESLRQVKDHDELATMRRAIRLADDCFEHICRIARPGVSERELAWSIEVFLRENGADRLAFDSIVASGPNAALPHAHPSDRRLAESGGPEFVIFDYGAEVDGYCSDITRTLVVGGEPTTRHREVYDAVLRAQAAALAAIRPGAVGKDVDAVARESLAADGLGEFFTHSLGHSLGRETHDGIGFSRISELRLAPGMVLTVEPGVYLEGWGGVRIEDDIVVTESGCEILTRSARDLLAFDG